MVVNTPDFVSFYEMSLLRSLTSQRRRPNLLVVCSGRAFETVLRQLRVLCLPPFHRCEIPGVLNLPAYGEGTLLLHDVAELTIGQQVDLADWLERRRGDVQVVSVTKAALPSLVNDGKFLEGLFHSLNTVSVRATAPLAGGAV
jgi:sigma-54-interacting transcriptional regulator